MSRELQVLQIDQWGGLNLQSPDRIEDNQLQLCSNFLVNEAGELYPRPGVQYKQIVPDVHIDPLPPPLPDGSYNITWVQPHNPYDPSVYALPTSRASGAPSTFIHCLINGKLYYSVTSPPNFLRAYEYGGEEIQIDDFYISANALYAKGSTATNPDKLFRVFDSLNVEIVQDTLANVSDHLVKPWGVFHKGRHWALEQSTEFPNPSVSGVWDQGQWEIDQWGVDSEYSPLTPWPSRNIRFSIPIDFDDYDTYFKEDVDSPLVIPEDLGYPLQLIPYRDQMLVLTTRNVLVLQADGTPDQWNLQILFDNFHHSTACVHNDLIYLAGREGVYVTDGNSLTKISSPLDRAFLAYDWVYGDWPEGKNGTNLELYNAYSQPQIFSYGSRVYIRLWTAEFEGDLIYQDTERQWGNWIVQPRAFMFNTISQAWSEININIPESQFPRVRNVTFIEPMAGFQEADGTAPLGGIYFNFTAIEPEQMAVYWWPWHLIDPNFTPEQYGATFIDYLDAGNTFECRIRTKAFDMGIPWQWKRGHWGGISYDEIETGTFAVDGNVRNFIPLGYSKFPIHKRFRETSFDLSYVPGLDTELKRIPRIGTMNILYTQKSKVLR